MKKNLTVGNGIQSDGFYVSNTYIQIPDTQKNRIRLMSILLRKEFKGLSWDFSGETRTTVVRSWQNRTKIRYLITVRGFSGDQIVNPETYLNLYNSFLNYENDLPL